MASASGYNHQRFARAVLKKSRKWEPSLTVQLFPNHWRFENSQITFQYDGPMKPFLLSLRSQVIPASLIPFLYDIRPPVSFVDGCLVVEIQDFRKNPEARSRIVMRPAAETMAQTIEVMLEKRSEAWDEQMALELESRIISATSPPLYLGTSILATRNALLSLSLTSPASPHTTFTGQPRSLHQGSELPSTDLENTRKLLRAGQTQNYSSLGQRLGGGSGSAGGGGGGGGGGVGVSGSGSGTAGGGVGFQPNWSILRLKERLESISRLREKENLARARGELGDNGMGIAGAGGMGMGGLNGMGQGSNGLNNGNGNGMGLGANGNGNGNGNPGGGGGEKKKTKKKRQVLDDNGMEAPTEGGEKPTKKKKKVDDSGGNGNGNANGVSGDAAVGGDEAPKKKKKKKVDSGAGTGAGAGEEGEPVKVKKVKVKKKDEYSGE